MIGAGADNRQAQGDVDAIVKIKRFQRDQCLIVVHAQRHIIAIAGVRGEQAIGAVRAGDRDSLGRQRSHRRCDDRGVFAAHSPVFTGMRIECGDGNTGRDDPEIAHQCHCHDPGLALNQGAGQQAWHILQGNVYRQRHRPQSRPGQHHHRIARRVGTGGGNKFGLAGKVEADFGEPRFGDWRSDQCCGFAGAGQLGRFGQRGQRQFCARAAGHPGGIGTIGSGQHRQCVAKQLERLGRVENFGYWQDEPAPMRRRAEHFGPACDEKWHQVFGVSPQPRLGQQFGADPRWIAQRHSEGGQIHAD